MKKCWKGSKRGFVGAVRKNERGQVLVELALCATVYVMLILGMFDLSRVLFRLHQFTQVAREGARIASMTVNVGSNQAAVIGSMNQILVNMGLPIADTNGLAVVITPLTVAIGGTPTDLVDIRVSQPVGSILNGASLIPGLAAQVISATISMPQFVTNPGP